MRQTACGRTSALGWKGSRFDVAASLPSDAASERRQLRRPRAVERPRRGPARSRARRRRARGAAAGRRATCRRGRRTSIGKRRRSPKIAVEHVDVFRRRDAAEQHDVAVRPDLAPAARARWPRAAGGSSRCPRRRRRARTRATAACVTQRVGAAQPGVRRDRRERQRRRPGCRDPAAARTAARRSACRGSTGR